MCLMHEACKDKCIQQLSTSALICHISQTLSKCMVIISYYTIICLCL